MVDDPSWRVHESGTTAGRCVVAQRSLAPGHLLITQQPYAAVLYDDQQASRCDLCFSCVDAPLRCSRCKLVRYCSRDHQAAAWRSGHKEECAALASCAPRVPPPTVRLAARVLWRRARDALVPAGKAAASTAEQGPHGGYAAVDALLSHWDDLDDDRKALYAQMAVVTSQFMSGAASAAPAPAAAPAAAAGDSGAAVGPADLPPPPAAGVNNHREVALLLARFACNSHTVCDDELRPLGVGLYPLGAMLNHSCRPNCMQSFRGPIISFRVISDIALGEECTISYVELAATRRQRRSHLLSLYMFDIDGGTPAVSTSGSAGGTAGAAAGPQLTKALLSTPAEHPAGAASAAGRGGADSRSSSADTTSCSTLSSAAAASAGAPAAAEACPTSASTCPAGTAPAAAGQPSARTPPPPLPAVPPLVPLAEQSIAMDNSCRGDARETADVRVCVYSVGASPPWPCDAVDAALTQRVVLNSGKGKVAGGLSAQIRPADGDATPISAPATPIYGAGKRWVVDVECWGRWALAEGEEAAAAAAAAAAAGAGGAGSGDASGGDAPAVSAAALSLASRVAGALLLLRRSTATPAELVQGLGSVLRSLSPGGATPGGGSGSAAGELVLVLGPAHALRIALDAALLKAAVDAGGPWPLALQAAERLLEPYQLIYTPVWPNLSLHWALVAKLRMLLEDPRGAAAAARASVRGLRVTHPGSEVLRSVELIQRQAEMELAHPEEDPAGHRRLGQ